MNLETHVSKVEGYLYSARRLAELAHPNIQGIIGLAFSGPRAFFLYPRGQGTDLKSYLRHPDVVGTFYKSSYGPLYYKHLKKCVL